MAIRSRRITTSWHCSSRAFIAVRFVFAGLFFGLSLVPSIQLRAEEKTTPESPASAGPMVPSTSPLPPGSLWKFTKGTGGHALTVTSVDFSLDGRHLATASRDRSVRIWDLATGAVKQTLDGHGVWLHAVRFSPDGKQVAVAGLDRNVRLWRVATGEQETELIGHTNGVNTLAYSPDGRYLATGARDRSLRIWDLTTQEQVHLLPHADGWVVALGYAAGGDRLFSAIARGNEPIREWNTTTGEDLRVLKRDPQPDDQLLTLAVSPDGRIVAGSGTDRRIHIWNLARSEIVYQLSGHTAEVSEIAFSPDGRLLVSGSLDHRVKIWEVDSGQLLTTLSGHSAWVASVAFSHDGRKIASGGGDANVIIWDLPATLWQTHLADGGAAPSSLVEEWGLLASASAKRAYLGMTWMVAQGEATIDFLATHLRPAPVDVETPRLIDRLIEELDDDDFRVRERATQRLAELFPLAQNRVAQALEETESAEVRSRAKELLSTAQRHTVAFPEQLRDIRAIQVLEQIGTPEAIDLLERMAEGARDARATQDAKLALVRMARRKSLLLHQSP